MIGKILKKFSGTLDYDALLSKSISTLESWAEDSKNIISAIPNSEERATEWVEYIKPDLEEISQATSRKGQILKLREKIVDNIEYSHIYRPAISKDFCDEDRRIIISDVFKDQSYDDALKLALDIALYSQAAYTCYIVILVGLGDELIVEHFQKYSEIYGQFTTQSYSEITSQAKGEKNVLGPLLPALVQMKDDFRETVLRGV